MSIKIAKTLTTKATNSIFERLVELDAKIKVNKQTIKIDVKPNRS